MRDRQVTPAMAEEVHRLLFEEGKSFAETLAWFDAHTRRRAQAHRARTWGTRCPGCGQTDCQCSSRENP